MQQQLQNEPSAEVSYSAQQKERSTEESLCQESSEQEENLIVPPTDQQYVGKLLVTLQRHTRLQKVLRWGGTLLGISTLLDLGLHILALRFPAIWPLAWHLAPFKHTAAITPEQAEAVQRTFAAANPSQPAMTVDTLMNSTVITSVDMWTPTLLMLGCFLFMGLARWQRGKLSRMLAKYDDLRAVGPLAQSLEMKEKRVASAAADALIRLLPRLQATDAERLTAGQHACLQRALQGRNPELILAILKAFEQIGNESDIPAVMQLAGAQTGKRVSPNLQQAASTCLEFLRQKVDRDRARQSLLRPAERETTPAAHLLRPAHGFEDNQPNRTPASHLVIKRKDPAPILS